MNTFGKLLRLALVAAAALVGLLMAMALLVSTAVALAIVYVVARLRGKPMVASAYWNAMPKARFGFGKAAAPQAAPEAPKVAPLARRPRHADVIDVEVRDIP